jgi:diaminopimelate epimerase
LQIPFIKMHGLGNDFIIFDNIKNPKIHDKIFLQKISDRRFGIGCDQVMVIEDTIIPENFRIKMYNSDGSETGACGNGSRCVADYLMNKNNLKSLVLETISGNLKCSKSNNLVTVNMGKPKFNWFDVPLSKNIDPKKVKLGSFDAFCLSMGNPHAVIFLQNIDELESLDLNAVGPTLEKNSLFPEFANIEFACILNDGSIKMRVWERGVGVTLACGSGACATLVAASSLSKSPKENKIILDGGHLVVNWLNDGSVTLSGDVEKIFEGILG